MSERSLSWADARDPEVLLTCGLGSGFLTPAPGTWGTVLGLVLWWYLLAPLEPLLQLGVTLIVFVLGCWLSGRVCRRYELKDPGAIVIDEIVGLWVALLGLNQALWPFALAGFVLFRLFDIWKPGPVGWADRTFVGGFGVMTDDLLAGSLAALLLQVAFFAFMGHDPWYLF